MPKTSVDIPPDVDQLVENAARRLGKASKQRWIMGAILEQLRREGEAVSVIAVPPEVRRDVEDFVEWAMSVGAVQRHSLRAFLLALKKHKSG